MKKLIIINNYHDGIPEKRLKGFAHALNPVKNIAQYEYILYNTLNDGETYKKVLKADGLILSGSHLFLSDAEAINLMQNVLKLIDDFKKPILGICLGHQLIGAKFGFKISDLEFPYIGKQTQRIITLKLIRPFELIKSDTITVELNHSQEIKYTSEFDEVFDFYASSDSCKLQIIKHKDRPIFGVQFHPETVADRKAQDDGSELIRNFVEML